MAISIVTVSSNKNDNNIQDLITSKIDEDLKEIIKTRTPDSKVSVIVVLKEQPAHDISIKVKNENKKDLEEILKPAKDIYIRIKPLRNEEELKKKSLSAIISNERSLLTDNEKTILKNVAENTDSKRKEMRREILHRSTTLADNSQKPLVNKINARGGIIKYSSKIYNAIVADIPISYIEELSKDTDIYMIYHNNILTASLDISTQAMEANTLWDNGYNGSSTDVAIIDTGIDATHPNLSVDYAGVFHAEGKTDENYGDDNISTDDLQGHGTHVAGIIASNDATYRGAGYGLDKLINAKAGWNNTNGTGTMYLSDGMEAINWSIFGNEDDADVISFSFGGPPQLHSQFEHFLDAISYSLDIPVVVAAGNNGLNGAHTVDEPANAFNILAVGNIDDKNTVNRLDDDLTSSSSRGPTYDGRIKPDISAPGTSILSTNYNWETENDFISMTGTSMAAPHIAGAVLLILDHMNTRWPPEAIKALLLNTAEDKGNAGPDNSYGYGYVDLSNAYIHMDDVFNGSINNTPDGSVEMFYKGTAYEGDRATLVWNRHIIYNYTGYYNPYANLIVSDLDLYMYNETNGSQISISTSSANNSEQVKSNVNHSSVILKIDPYGTFPYGIMSEDFALATEEGFSEVAPPILKVNVSNSGSVNGWDNFDIYVNVTNYGGIIAHNVSVNITLPSGFSIVSGANPQSLGSINNESSNTTSWVLKAPRVDTSASFTLNISAISLSYDESFSGQGNNTIWVNGDGYINGTVFNGTGIGGVIVKTDSGGSTTTSESGFYLIQVPPGSNNLTVRCEPEYYQNSSILVNAISGATVVQDIELRKKPAGTISGYIRNS